MAILRFTSGEKVTFSLYQKLSDAKKYACGWGSAPRPVGGSSRRFLVGWGGVNPL